MKKKSLTYMIAALALCAAGCTYDDDALQDRLDAVTERIKALQTRIDSYNEAVGTLDELLSGNVITSMEETGGRYVITYLDSKGVSRTVELATEDQMINAPLLGVRKDSVGLYWWTVTVDGTTSDVKDASGQSVPVAGEAPVLSVNAEGYWTVGGVVINYPGGGPVPAEDGSNAVIKALGKDADGNLVITLGDGTSVTVPVQKALNLKLDCQVSNVIVDPSKGFEIAYEAEGSSAASAIVDIAEAKSLSASIDPLRSIVTVSFPSGFESGRLVLFAYDFKNTVIRPVFFSKAGETTIKVHDASELKAAADRINSMDGAELMEIVLESDIDLGGASWTPVGDGTVTTDGVVSGASFKGTFRGQGHTVDNFTVEVDSTAADGTAAGFFGVLNGATVSGLNIGSGASVTSSSAKTAYCGLVAGFALNSTIENCTNAGSVAITAVTDEVREAGAGIVGSIYTAFARQTVVRGCTNEGPVSSVNAVNRANGSTGVSIAGIVGFADGADYSLIQSCTNSGTVSGQATRMAGVCASAYSYVKVSGCTNSGAVTGSDVTASNSRIAGICSASSTETYFSGCINTGDVTFAVADNTTQGYAAGILAQANNAVTIDGCWSCGSVLSDIYKSQDLKYIGVIIGNCNDKAVTVTGCRLGGSVGPYTEDETFKVVTLTEGNYAGYVTLASSKTGGLTLGENFFSGSAPTGIMTLSDLKEFRDSVNAGKTFTRFQSSDGSVKLLADIDMSSETTWEPIGDITSLTLSQNYAVPYSGPAFSGVFDGGGHVIRHFAPVAEVASGRSFGLFGAVVDGTVRNLTIGEEGDAAPVKVSSSGYAAAGVLAGAVINSSIIDCTNYAPFEFDGSSVDNQKVATGVFAGLLNSQGGKCSGLSGLVNNADCTVKSGSNTKNGATGVHFGGIAGFSSGTQNSKTDINTIENCTNCGDIRSTVGRSAGIVAAANTNTCIRYCVNRGSQVNDFADARIANITCIIGVNGVIDDCTNYGDITTSHAKTTAGAIVALPNHATVVITGGANYGTIICANSSYHGLLAANLGTFASIDGFYVDGACGTYSADGNHVMHSLTKDTWMSHIGGKGSSTDMSKVTNLSSRWGNPSAAELPDLQDASLRILFIGNSFTKDAVEHLPGLLTAAGITDVTLAHCYYGGRMVYQYNNGWSSTGDYTLYYKDKGQSAWTTHSSKVTLKQVAESGRWDIVTIQEHTGNYAAWSWTADEKAAVQGLVDKCVATQTTKPKTYYILSQAYYNMDKIGSASKPYITWTDQKGMYDVIVAQGKKVGAETTVDGILSTCTCLQNLRTSSVNNAMDLTRDGYHMDYGISRYAAACLMFESLISPKFQVKLDSNTYRYANSSTTDGSYSTPVTDDNAPIALQAARYAIEKPYEITDMSK